jgi:hypothetical protein
LNSAVADPHFAHPAYPWDDYRLVKGAPATGFTPFDASENGRYWWARWNRPPVIAPTFSVMNFNPATDF